MRLILRTKNLHSISWEQGWRTSASCCWKSKHLLPPRFRKKMETPWRQPGINGMNCIRNQLAWNVGRKPRKLKSQLTLRMRIKCQVLSLVIREVNLWRLWGLSRRTEISQLETTQMDKIKDLPTKISSLNWNLPHINRVIAMIDIRTRRGRKKQQ